MIGTALLTVWKDRPAGMNHTFLDDHNRGILKK